VTFQNSRHEGTPILNLAEIKSNNAKRKRFSQSLPSHRDTLPQCAISQSSTENLNCNLPTKEHQIERKSSKHIYCCLAYLDENQAYTHEGIFRKCGDFTTIQNVKSKLSGGRLSEKMLDSLGVFGCADLLKNLLSGLEYPLVDGYSVENIQSIMKAVCSKAAEAKYCRDQLLSFYLHAVLRRLPKRSYKVLTEILQFLCKIIEHEEQSKMGKHNIATVFVPLLFPNLAKMTKDVQFIIQETELQIIALEFLLDLLVKHPDIFHEPQPAISLLRSCRNFRFNEVIIFIGDVAKVFHRTENYSFFVLSGRVHVLESALLGNIFDEVHEETPVSTSFVLRTPRKFKEVTKRFSGSFSPMMERVKKPRIGQ